MSDIPIPLSVPYLRGNEAKYLADCVQTNWVSSVGPYVERFESEVARLLRVPSAVACMNGTAALHLSLLLSGVEAGEEVIVPTVTFIAPVNAVRYVGAQPVFMDCDEFLNLDPQKFQDFIHGECQMTSQGLIHKATGRRIRAIIVVHVFGHPARLEPIKALAEKFGLKLIEDATESIGSYYKGGSSDRCMTGTFGDFGCFSFNGNKLVTAGGGGMLIASNPRDTDRARYLSTQAKDDEVYFKHDEVGYNYRMTNLQAAVGVAQMEQLSTFINIKRENFRKYHEGLIGIDGLSWIEEPSYANSNFWHYSLVVKKMGTKDRDGLMMFLKEHRVESRPLWNLCHHQKPYRDCLAYKIERAEEFEKQVLNLPCSLSLKDSDIGCVVELLKTYYRQ